MSAAQRITRHMERRGLSRRALARMTCLSEEEIRAVLEGRSPLTERLAVLLARPLALPPRALLAPPKTRGAGTGLP